MLNLRKMSQLLLFFVVASGVSLDAMQDNIISDNKKKQTKAILYSVPVKKRNFEGEKKDLGNKWSQELAKTYTEAKDPHKSSILVNAWLFTNQALMKDLVKAHKKGVHVRVVIGSDSLKKYKKELLELSSRGLSSFKVFEKNYNNHAKFLLWDYVDKNGKKQKWYSSGSANFTNLGVYHNNETVEFCCGDIENYDQLRNLFIEIDKSSVSYEQVKNATKGKKEEFNKQVVTPERSKVLKIVQDTPDNRSVLTSLTYDIWNSVLKRFDKTNQAGDSIVISCFTYNNDSLTEKLIGAYKSGVKVTLFIDKASLKNSHAQEQIKKLSELGISIYCYSGSGIKIHHSKFVLFDRQKNKEKIVISTSKNPTETSKDIDVMTIDGSDEALFKAYSDLTDKWVKEKGWSRISSLQDIKNLSQQKIRTKKLTY